MFAGHIGLGEPASRTGVNITTGRLTLERARITSSRKVNEALLHFDSVNLGGQSSKAAGSEKMTRAEAIDILKNRRDLASDTYERPRGQKQIQALLNSYMHRKDPRDRPLVMSFQISAKDLTYLHPGSVAMETARHLHPNNPGLSTDHPHADESLITVVWKYPKPKPGQLCPDQLQLTDGTLVAAFLTKEAGDMSAFESYSAKVLDECHGNRFARDPASARRVFRSTIHRFKLYFTGMGEGLSVPRFNGQIGANLLLTSLPISALLYGVLYGMVYLISSRRQHDVQKHMAPPMPVSNGSTYAMSN